MTSELHKQLVQELTNYNELFEVVTEDEKQGQFGARSVSKSNDIRSELNQLLKPKNNEEVTDEQLFNRVCSVCKIDTKKQNVLRKLCSSSPKEGATALSNVIIESAQKNIEKTIPKPVILSPEAFYNKLQEWENKGDGTENRTEAAKRIRKAYKNKFTTLNLMGLP